MIEHVPWKGEFYNDGVRGQRVAICGYSHYSDDHDHDDLTRHIVGDVVTGAARYSFFTSIARAFGHDDMSFWKRVLFLNFVPAIVGDKDAKFAVSSSSENERARQRLWRVLLEHRPTRLLVFSEKAWAACPKTDEERAGLAPKGAEVRSGTYTMPDGHRVRAFGLRHPQGVTASELRASVEAAFGTS